MTLFNEAKRFCSLEQWLPFLTLAILLQSNCIPPFCTVFFLSFANPFSKCILYLVKHFQRRVKKDVFSVVGREPRINILEFGFLSRLAFLSLFLTYQNKHASFVVVFFLIKRIAFDTTSLEENTLHRKHSLLVLYLNAHTMFAYRGVCSQIKLIEKLFFRFLSFLSTTKPNKTKTTITKRYETT